jgi:4-amino-4-deoxy-L-arabinose transferase-like glycosyltransferase
MGPILFLKEHATALLLLLLLSLVEIDIHFNTVALTMDGVTYLQIARNILHGKGLGWQASWAPPLHSILIAAVSYISGIDDLLLAATIVSVLMGFLLIVAVYVTAYQVFDRKTALISASIAALSPHLLRITFSDEAEITYTFFLTLSLALITLALKRDAWIYSVLTGVSFALAYLARSEGFLIMAMILSSIVVLQGKTFYRSRVFAKCIVCTVVFLMVASPYVFFLKKHYGAFVISPKTSYVMIWMQCVTYHDNNKGEEGNDELWGLNSDGKLRWQEPKGVGDLIDYLGSHPQKSISIYFNNLSHEIPGRIPNGSGMDSFPQLFPVYLAFFAIFSVFLAWGPLGREKKGILIAPLAIIFIFPIFTNGWWKYLVPYLPIVIILATYGFMGGVRYIAKKISINNVRPVEITLLIVGVLSVGCHFTSSFFQKSQPAPINARQSIKDLERADAKKAAEYGLRLLGPGNNYMISWSPLVYYLNGFWTARPVASLQEQLDYARENNVDYYVLDASFDDIALLDLPGLQMVGLYISEKTSLKVGFYRIPKF